MAGLFITAEPQIFGINADDDSNTADESTSSRILWPLCFALGFLPIGLMNVICEKELKSGEVCKMNQLFADTLYNLAYTLYTISIFFFFLQAKSFNFIMWSQFAQIICMVCLFWTDFIPGFGMVCIHFKNF